MKEVFTEIFEKNLWKDDESASGPGSSYEQTKKIIEELPKLFRKFNIHSILDIPCGDFNWMKKVDLSGITYIGADIVNELVNKNYYKYDEEFMTLDITKDKLPRVDVVFVRDCLVHFSNKDIYKALKNIYKSGAKYLLTTTFPEHYVEHDIIIGPEGWGWRPLNFQKRPFNFPEPIAIINEGCTEANGVFSDKSLGLWEIETIYPLINKNA